MLTPPTPRRVTLSVGCALGLTGASLALVGGPAAADPASVPGPVSITATGAYSGTVPNGVCSVEANVLGAAGGHNVTGGGVSTANANGGGARIVATYTVVPGMTYSGTVGGGGIQAATIGNPGSGGSNGGGSGGTVTNATHPGSGGGGWTDLQLDGDLVILAGGGGGSGGGHSLTEGFGGDGGTPSAPGVTAGTDGIDSHDTQAGNVVGGGQGGGPAAPGAGGTNPASAPRNGTAGSGRTGGNGGADTDPDSGGGGGGGYYGGGGGASTVGNGMGAPTASGIGGAGGGGGASYVAATSPDGTGSAVTALSSTVGPKRSDGGNGADGAVTLTWVPCDYDLAVTKSVSPTSASPGETVTWTVTVEHLGADPMTRGDTVTITDSLPGAGAKTITGITVSGGSNDRGLSRGAVTCSAGVGAAMPATLTCSRPYAAPGAPSAPSGGVRGIDPGESITITYTQVVPGPVGATLTNNVSVTDRATGDNDDTASAALSVAAAPPVPQPDTTTGPQGAPQTVDPLANDDPGAPTAPLDPASLTLLDAGGDPVSSVTVPGQGTYTINGSGEIVFTPEPDFVGTADPVTYRVADVNGTTATSTYTPTVTPVTAPDTTTGPQGQPQSVDPLANDTLDPAADLDPSTLTLVDPTTGDPSDSVTIPGQGTYTVNGSGEIVFTPEPDFTGPADPVTYQVEDADGNPLRDTYTPTVTPVTPDPNPDTTSGPQGQPQSIDPMANDDPGDPGVPLVPSSLTLLDAGGDPTDSVTVPGQGTYTVNGSGEIVFTPEPDFVGTADPVTYRVADVNGTTATSTYTPTVTPVVPDANADETTGPQGQPQSIDPLANDGPGDPSAPLVASSLTLLDAGGDPTDSVTVPGQGAYTINGSGEIVFTPEPDFVGTADPVTYRVADVNGTTATSTYTPTVTPVVPEPHPDTTSGPQGRPQSIDPLANDDAGAPSAPLDPATLTLLDGDGDGNPVDSVTIPGQGTYTLNDAGRIVFTPEPDFVGTADPVTYRIADVNGTTATSTYTPTLTPVAPTANPDRTHGPINKPQSVNPFANDEAGDPDVPLDLGSLTLLDDEGNPTDRVVVPGQGVFTVEGHRIVFTPETGFTGKADPVTYRIADVNGTTATSTYTPVIDAEPITVVIPETAPQGSTVVIDLTDEVPNLDPATVVLIGPDGEEVTRLVVPGEGTWTVDPVTGEVTFVPEPGFTGDPTPIHWRGQTYGGREVTGTLIIKYYAPGGGLPDTGSSAWLVPGLGLALVLLSGGAWLIRRGRRVTS